MPRNWTPEQTAAMTVTGKTLLVSAAAGSGKTATLTERIIRRVTEGADITRMLIVTFTRSAAAELRARISDALSAAIAEHPENGHLAKQLVALGSADIQTIDSFCMGPVREHFERLGLPAAFRIADEAEMFPLKRQILEDTVTEFYERYGNEEEGNRFTAFADDLMTAGATGFPYDLLIDFYDTVRNQPEGIRLLSEYADTYTRDVEMDFFSTEAGKLFSECVREEVGCYLGKLSRAKELLVGNDAYVTGFFPLLSAEEEYLRAILRGLDEGYAAAYLAANTAPPAGRLSVKKDAKTEVGTRVHEEHKIYRKAITGLGKKYFYTAPEDIPEQFRATAGFCTMLYELLSEYDVRLGAEKRTRGVADFTDITRNMLALLTADGTHPSDLAASLADNYDEVYIDEYQDVNEMQDLIFSFIGGNHRFMVGDIKQCIYAFRGSDPSLFAEYRRRFPAYGTAGAEEATGNSIFMSDNFRCDKSIIEFSNTVCRPLFSVCRESVGYRPEDDLKKSKPDPSEGYVSPKVTVAYFCGTGTDDGEDGGDGEDSGANASSDTPDTVADTGTGASGIPGEATDGTDGSTTSPDAGILTEAAWIADTVAALLRDGQKADGSPIRASDIAILSRRNTPLYEIDRELSRRGIATTFSGGSGLSSSPEMKFLLNLLAVIDNPQSDVPLYETLLHPVFGFTTDDLLGFHLSASDGASLFDAMCEAAEGSVGGAAEHARGFVSWLASYRRLSLGLPADRFLRELYRDPLLSRMADSDAFLCAYDTARHYQSSISTGLYQFLGFFRTAVADGKLSFRAGNAEADAVTMMTVHSSKGLEFPVCFLARCGSGFTMPDIKEEMLFHRRIGVTCRLSDHETLAKHSTLLRDCAIFGYRRDTVEEEMRILYVALTRARERLYVSATVRTRDVDTFLERAGLADPEDTYTVRHAQSFAEWISMALAHCDPVLRAQTVEELVFDAGTVQNAAFGKMPAAGAASAGENAVPGEISGGTVTGSARDADSAIIHDAVAQGGTDSAANTASAADDESAAGVAIPPDDLPEKSAADSGAVPAGHSPVGVSVAAGAADMDTGENTESPRSGVSDETTGSLSGISDGITDTQSGIPGETMGTTSVVPVDTAGSLSGTPGKMTNSLPGTSREATLAKKIRLLPAKVAASKVTSGLADRLLEDEDGGDGGDIRARLELLRTSSKSFASLLGEGKAVLATDRGTAAHEFLQFCDYGRLATDGIASEFDRLVREKFITPRTAEIADREALEKFLTSDLFRLIRKAEKAEREVQFSLFLPYAEFTEDKQLKAALGDRLLHVQGSIDLLLTMPDGSLVLADYKTDRVPDAVRDNPERLCAFFTERHAHQLSVYRRAVRHLYGTMPEKTMIYSIPLGKSVEIRF